MCVFIIHNIGMRCTRRIVLRAVLREPPDEDLAAVPVVALGLGAVGIRRERLPGRSRCQKHRTGDVVDRAASFNTLDRA